MKKTIVTSILVLSLLIVHAHVQLIYPVGGESFYPGEEVTIEWKVLVPHEFQNWDLLYSLDGGATWEELQMDMPLETLLYTWVVPENPTEEARIRIIQDNVGVDYEDESENFTITNPSGINSFAEQSNLRIYPNPAKDHIYVESDISVKGAKLHIVNAAGNVVAVHDLRTGTLQNNRQIIHLDGLKPGMYFLYFKSEEHVSVEKLMIY